MLATINIFYDQIVSRVKHVQANISNYKYMLRENRITQHI